MEANKPLRILVVGESSTDREWFHSKLEQASLGEYEFRHADKSPQLRRLIDSYKPDLMFLGKEKDDRGASDAVRRVMGSSQSQQFPIIVLSGEESSNPLQPSANDRDFDILPKEGLESRELLYTIASAIKRHNLKRTIHEQRKQLERLNNMDVLTGLLNRRAILEKLEELTRRSRRYSHPLTVALCDLDHFRHINETYGFLAGDRVLATFSELAKNTLRETDLVARYGGEEFCLVLVDTDIEAASLGLDRLRKNLARKEIPDDFGESIFITASFGVVSFNRDMNDVSEFMDQADRLLSEAKQSGRNRIHLEQKNRQWVIGDNDSFE